MMNIRKSSGKAIQLMISLGMLFALLACDPGGTPAPDSFLDSADRKEMDVNSGLTIQKSFPAEPDYDEIVSLIVLNHTDEPIAFPNSGYGLSIFCADDNDTWQKQDIPTEYFTEKHIIPPKTESLDFELENINVTIVERTTISKINCTEPRLFVQGIGQETGTEYGAYADIVLSP